MAGGRPIWLQFNGHETGGGELILRHAGKLGIAALRQRAAGQKERLARTKVDLSGLRFIVGNAPIEARERLKIERPGINFESWCRSNFPQSRRTCYRCMAHAKRIYAGQIPGLKTAIKAGIIPQEWIGAAGTVSSHHSKSVQTISGIFRKMNHADKLSFVGDLCADMEALMEEIANADDTPA